MEEIFYQLFVEGYDVDDIGELYAQAMLAADKRYGEYKREQARKEQEERERRERLEYEKKRRAEAREALGAAIIEYFSAIDLPIVEKTYKDVEYIIDALPQLKVVRGWTGGKFW